MPLINAIFNIIFNDIFNNIIKYAHINISKY